MGRLEGILDQRWTIRLGLLASLLVVSGCRKTGLPAVPEGYREFAYVANAEANTVTVLDLIYLRPERTLQVGANPVALAVNSKRDEVYVLNADRGEAGGSVSVIDTKQNAVVATMPVRRGAGSITIDDGGHRAYVANRLSSSITVLDLDTRKVVGTVAANGQPNAAAIAPDGRTLVVTNGVSGSVSLFSALPIGPPLILRATFPGCAGAASPVILPDSSKAFIACAGGHQVMALSLAADPGTWAGKQDATLLTDHVLAMLDVGLHPGHLTMKPDGGEVFASNSDSDSISEISTQTNEVGSTYPIGNVPAHGVVSADGGALWVSNSGADSISLYSIDDGRLLSNLRTGPGPDALAFSADGHLLLAADTKSGDVAVIRTASKLGPALFTMLPAGGTPVALVTKAMQGKP